MAYQGNCVTPCDFPVTQTGIVYTGWHSEFWVWCVLIYSEFSGVIWGWKLVDSLWIRSQIHGCNIHLCIWAGIHIDWPHNNKNHTRVIGTRSITRHLKPWPLVSLNKQQPWNWQGRTKECSNVFYMYPHMNWEHKAITYVCKMLLIIKIRYLQYIYCGRYWTPLWY